MSTSPVSFEAATTPDAQDAATPATARPTADRAAAAALAVGSLAALAVMALYPTGRDATRTAAAGAPNTLLTAVHVVALVVQPLLLAGTLARTRRLRAAGEAHRRTMEELIALVRAEGAAGVPLVAGFDWADDLTPVRADPVCAEGVAYVAHPYPQKRPAPWPDQWERDWGFVADRYPVVATELAFMQPGERGAHVPVLGNETYGRAIVDYFGRRGISWTAWVFDPDWSPQLLTGWAFQPTRQGVVFRDALRRLNAPVHAPVNPPAR